ncbi:MAG: BBP7 family outer membrane beta-barrel protein [Gemmataceae bacterium]|nr:BBP7 family outer membrane beta-barrel protein [Gemmataceae bacterium]
MRTLRFFIVLGLALLTCGDLRADPTTQPISEWACNDCAKERCFYASAEYLLWWLKASPVPAPLLTTSTDATTNPRAILGLPGTVVLFGGQSYDLAPSSGGRVTAGWQLSSVVAVEASGFLLQSQSRRFSVRSDAVGNPVLATPFFDAVNNQEFSSFYSLPTPTGGSAAFEFQLTNRLWGAEANATARVFQNDCVRLNVLAGFRYVDLQERLRIRNAATFFGATDIFQVASFPPFSQFPGFDDFDTRNQFYGGQLGAQLDVQRGKFLFCGQVKVALGAMHQVVTIAGSTGAIPPGSSASVLSVPGDSYALLSNIGRTTQNEFAVVPEVRLSVGYQITEHVNVSVGYNFLYLSDVLRPGDQIDRRVNAALIPTFGIAPPGALLPAVPLKSSDFFAHGINFALGVQF